MSKSPWLVMASLALCVALVHAEDAAPKLETEDQKTLYALGLSLSRSLETLQLSPTEFTIVERGMRDGALKKKPEVELETYGPKIQTLAQGRMAKVAETEKEEATKFLQEAAKKKNVKKGETGFLYEELKAGKGESPKADSKVKVHYHGTLRDGSVFDSSVARGEPVTFPLGNVIQCWTEGLQTMKVGGKTRFWCPADLAYKERGAPPLIKPGAALVFEVELLEIEK